MEIDHKQPRKLSEIRVYFHWSLNFAQLRLLIWITLLTDLSISTIHKSSEVKQELLTLPEYWSSPSFFSEVRSIFSFLCSVLQIIDCPFVLSILDTGDYRGRDRMVVGFTTKVLISNPAHGEVYWIQHYVIKFVSDLWQVDGFLRIPLW